MKLIAIAFLMTMHLHLAFAHEELEKLLECITPEKNSHTYILASEEVVKIVQQQKAARLEDIALVVSQFSTTQATLIVTDTQILIYGSVVNEQSGLIKNFDYFLNRQNLTGEYIIGSVRGDGMLDQRSEVVCQYISEIQ